MNVFEIIFKKIHVSPNCQTFWHGTSLLPAYNIVHHAYVTGKYGHTKNGRRVNGIWGSKKFAGALQRAATSRSYQRECLHVAEGIFDAWSAPVAIEFVAKPTDVLTRVTGLSNVGCLDFWVDSA